VWQHPDYPGMLIDASDDDGREYTIFVGDPMVEGKTFRLTQFDNVTIAMNFCERVAPLADWPRAAEWGPAGAPGLDKQCHEIALALTQASPNKAPSRRPRRRAVRP
jgi:hypothetical protein